MLVVDICVAVFSFCVCCKDPAAFLVSILPVFAGTAKSLPVIPVWQQNVLLALVLDSAVFSLGIYRIIQYPGNRLSFLE